MAKGYSTVTKGPTQRQRRAGELIRQVLAEIIVRGDIHDPDMPAEPITISEVRSSPDLRNATVYCTVLGRADASEAIAVLNKLAGKIRTALGAKIEMKYTPALYFTVDDSFEEAARISALLENATSKG